MKKKLRHFKVVGVLKACQSCNCMLEELSAITVRTYDSSHKYVGSKRGFIMNYSIKVCPKCFEKLQKQILSIIV